MSLSHVGVRMYRFVAALLVVLWSFAALWLTGGVAHADDTASHEASQSTSTPSADNGASEDEPAKHAEPAVAGDKTDTTTKPVHKPRGARKHATAGKPESKPDSKSDSKPESRSDSKSEPGPGSNVGTTSDTKLTQTAKKPATATTTATAGVSTAALKLATPSVLPSATAKAPNPIAHAAQFVRQMTGLANDIGLLAVTVVNNLAAAAATAIGPKPLFGVPYHVAAAIAGTAATAGRLLSGTPLNATGAGPFKVTYGVGDLLNYFNPNKVPAGAHDASVPVTPNAEHPIPVILIAGTAANAPFNWSVGAPVLANAGYTVFTFNYGNVTKNPAWPVRGTGDIPTSAQELSDEVDKVLAATGADKVILIGHSQGGGMTPEYYLNNLGGAAKVAQFIGIAPAHHGADIDGLAYIKNVPVIGKALFGLVNLLGPAWLQQSIGSPLIDTIYGNGDTRPGVQYTTISTKYDWIATPYTNQALVGENVTNIVLQDLYPNFNAGHLGLVFAKPTWDVVLGALAAHQQANPTPVAGTVAA